MAKPKTVSKNVKLDIDKYINIDTGETLISSLKGKELIIKEATGQILITTEDYVIVDSKALSFLKEHLNRSELGSISILSEDLKTPYNIIYNNNVPHTNETLQNTLGFSSQAMFMKLIKKLIIHGVLYQIKGNIMGNVRVIYMMNPFLARKRKTVDEELIKVFKEFKK